ncbi:hypothetical protein [Bacillus sp. ISL-55]|uniref:hypothetical protein n=1 Tax=Bacillus sp. ISL-55 TaxID=2819134 RepID=UPI001BED2261|nr:hypothetical protein [Bacillus sp. ISL-55]MBT2694627.1 hypothetical protein [Bacillus sp. ISL-55]
MPKDYKSITISFKPEAIHLYEFTRKQSNKSAYILKLIQKDMEGEDDASLKQTIKAIILEILNDKDITLNESKKVANEETLTDYDIGIINEYF